MTEDYEAIKIVDDKGQESKVTEIGPPPVLAHDTEHEVGRQLSAGAWGTEGTEHERFHPEVHVRNVATAEVGWNPSHIAGLAHPADVRTPAPSSLVGEVAEMMTEMMGEDTPEQAEMLRVDVESMTAVADRFGEDVLRSTAGRILGGEGVGADTYRRRLLKQLIASAFTAGACEGVAHALAVLALPAVPPSRGTVG
jgi:hypothetical protein